MANFRDIAQVEEITSFTESDKLIVNSNGVAKQIGIDLIAGGVPDGGTAGQVLTKTSDVDGEAEWTDLPEVPKEVVYVNITRTSDTEGTADMTFAEILEAYNSGAAIFARCVTTDKEMVVLPLAIYLSADLAGGKAMFGFIISMHMNNSEITVAIYADNTVKINDIRLSRTAAAVSDAAGETPTAAEFNALLTALRNAGLMKSPAVPK